MAPMTVSQQQYIKRSASSAGFDLPAAKKLHRRPLRHHKATYDFQRDIRQGAQWQDEGAVQDLLTRSIGLALEAVGFEATAPEALESFRVHVEECMHAHVKR